MTHRFPYIFFIGCFVLLLSAGCSKSDDQREFENRALTEPSEITETGSTGELTGNRDRDDWQIGPMYRGLISIGFSNPAAPYPNPLNYNQNLTLQIKFNVSDPVNAVEIRKFRTLATQPTQIRFLQQDELGTFNTITIQGKNIAYGEGSGANDIYRLLIYDGNYNLISYGDVRIQ